MRFEINENIRVLNRIGRQKVDTLNYATYLRPADNPCFLVVDCLGREYEVSNTNCYKWTPASDDDAVMAEWAREQIYELNNMIVAGVRALLCQKVTVAVEDNDDGLPSIQLDGMTVSVEPMRIERRCIGRITEKFGWSCTTYHATNNYPHAPDDVEDREYGTSMSQIGIAQLAVKAIADCIADNYWTHISECQMAEDLAAEGLIDEN
jgi:hypothetical protein